MSDIPRSLAEFEERFADEATCVDYLIEARWPGGFVCPGCRSGKYWRLESRPWTYECAHCGRQTSVTAGTLMHRTKLPLTDWFWAAYVAATQPRGLSALELQRERGLGSYKSAWLLYAKLRSGMALVARPELSGIVEVGTMAVFGNSSSAMAGSPPRQATQLIIAGAVEVHSLGHGRIRLGTVRDTTDDSLHEFLVAALVSGATPKIGGWRDPSRATSPWIRRVFDQLDAWASGTYHGLRAAHLQSYLDEFAFRFNTRRSRDAAFPALLGVAAAHRPVGCSGPFSDRASRATRSP